MGPAAADRHRSSTVPVGHRSSPMGPAGSHHAGLLRLGAPPLVIGHRGASAAAPENTMPAFRVCWDQGVSWIETDVQPSADLVPVLFHDHTLDRTTDGSGELRERRYRDLVTLDAGKWFGPAYAKFAATPIPTLHELLTALPPAAQVNLEIKGPHSAAELIAILAVVRATGTDGRVWISTFEEQVLRDLAETLPGAWLGLLREQVDADPVAVCREFRASGYHVERTALLDRPEAVQALHAAGISVLVYTADDEADWAALTDLEVDGIITNRPVELLTWQTAP